MENVPLQRTSAPLDIPSRSSKSPTKTSSNALNSQLSYIRTLSPLNLAPEDQFSPSATTTRRSQTHSLPIPTASVPSLHNTDAVEATTSDNQQLLTPPQSGASLASSASSSLDPISMAQATSSPSSSSRKRTRQQQAAAVAQATSALDSPNPKARKQARTLVPRDTSDSTEEADDLAPLPKSKATLPLATPARRSKRIIVPKSDKVATRVKPTTTRTRRKSAPGIATQKKKRTPSRFERLPEPESDGEDPLLLVGTDTWVPVPWMPMYTAEEGAAVKKEEDEGAALHALSTIPEPTDESTSVDTDAPHQVDQDVEMQPPSQSPSSSSPPNAAAPAHPPRASSPYAYEEDQSFLEHPEADSSFVGMEIDSDEDVNDFAIPLRLDSPPPRRRRSSAVSQRQETPGSSLSPGKAILSSAVSPPKRDALPRASPGPLRIEPATPFTLKRTSAFALAAATTSPHYPSPRFRGDKLGSLSPEKGRGPSRGTIPNMEHEPVAALHLSAPPVDSRQKSTSADFEEDDGGPADEPTSKSIGASAWSKSRDDDEERDQLESGSDQDHDQLDEEENAHSMQVERDLTEGLGDDDEDIAIDLPQRDNDVALKDESFELLVDSPRPQPPTTVDPVINRLLGPVVAEASEEYVTNGSKISTLLQAHEFAEGNTSQANAVNDTDSEDDGSQSDDEDDAPPVIEISSKDPMMAARAAAILKFHHDYVQEEARKKLRRRRSSAASLDLHSTAVSASPPTRRTGTPVLQRHISLRATPIPSEVLRQAEQQVASPEVLRGNGRRLAEAEATLNGYAPGTPEAGPSRLAAAQFSTPMQRIPAIVIDPASTRPTDRYLRRDEINTEDDRPWTKAEWKRLEQCLLSERKALADERGLEAGMIDVGDVDVDDVVRTFFEQERLIGDPEDWEGEGEWARDKVHRRCIALQVRHSRQPSGSIQVPGSPMVIPFTPLPSRQTTPISLFPNATVNGATRPEMQRSISPVVAPLAPTFMAPRYSHLYEEASSMAGLISAQDRPSPNPSPRGVSDSPSPAPINVAQKKSTISRIPSSSRIPRFAQSKKTDMLPPPAPPAPVHRTPSPILDTPSTASRVLNFLGLGSVGRSSKRPAVTIAPRRQVTPSAPAARSQSVDAERLYRRIPETSPIAAILIPQSRSKEDLHHIEPQPPCLPPPPPHPKDLVALNPVPPRAPLPAAFKPRRSSGGSVKDLVKTFESMEDVKDGERNRIRQIVRTGRRVISGGGPGSLRRMPSNLSTASVISAGDVERDDSETPSTSLQRAVSHTPASRSYASSIGSVSSTASRKKWF